MLPLLGMHTRGPSRLETSVGRSATLEQLYLLDSAPYLARRDHARTNLQKVENYRHCRGQVGQLVSSCATAKNRYTAYSPRKRNPDHRGMVHFPCRATHMPEKTFGKDVPAAA